MSQNVKLIIFNFLLLFTLIRAFQDCGSQIGHVTRVSVTDCDLSANAPCQFKRGTNCTIEIDFQTKQVVNSVTTKMFARTSGTYMAVALDDLQNACKNPSSGLTCPLDKGGSNFFKATLGIKGTTPEVSVTVMWLLLDENENLIVCIKIPGKIMS